MFGFMNTSSLSNNPPHHITQLHLIRPAPSHLSPYSHTYFLSASPSPPSSPQTHLPVSPTETSSQSTTNPLNSPANNFQPTSPPPVRHPLITRMQTGHLKPCLLFDLSHTTKTPSTPTSYTIAAKSPLWCQAMSEEFNALLSQGTWSLIPPPSSYNVLGSKRHSNGAIASYKARLVAPGFKQLHGVNYHDTFNPVAKFLTIHTLLTLATHRHWPMTQLDVSNAFLHGPLTEIFHMAQPPGFKDPQYPDHICRLHKAIYDLKQSPRQWYTTFSAFLQSLGFVFGSADTSLMTYHHHTTKLYILIYVDDILLTGNHSDDISQLITKLQARFSLKNLGIIFDFLGIEVFHTTAGLYLTQSAYARDILHRAGMSSCKPLTNPSSAKLQPTTERLQP